MAFGDFKDLNRRTVPDKILRDNALSIAKNPKHDGYQHGLASMVYKFFDKNISGSGIKNENTSKKELAEELQKPIIRKFQKRKVHSTFIDNICDVDLADMKFITKFNKEIHFLLCVIDIFHKYASVIPLKDKIRLQLLMLFKTLKESNRNEIWVHKGSAFYNRSMKKMA